jgi:hypothetical protein
MGLDDTAPRPAAPYRSLGADSLFYMLPFDKNGATTAPQTLEQAREALGTGRFTDVYVLCHGWNNNWEAATRRYDHFVDGYIEQGPADSSRRALLLGVFWPSMLLVSPGEKAPAMAVADSVPSDPGAASRADVTAELDEEAAARVDSLAGRDALDEREATELATLLAPVYASGVAELGENSGTPDPGALVRSWRQPPPDVTGPAERVDDDGDWGTADEAESRPQAASILDKLDPRTIIRGASVWVMKDRAGRVGKAAVGPLVREALNASQARVHLVGHSFGARVALSAVCAEPLARPVHSLLLLQPAVNHLCFAESVPRRGRPGGYRPALERVTRPMVTTYSVHDQPLTRFFHWALRRDSDLGEPHIAAWPEPPNEYAALGGFGPRGADAATQWLTLRRAGEPYALDARWPLAATDASAGIKGHSDVSNPWTWWALRELAS